MGSKRGKGGERETDVMGEWKHHVQGFILFTLNLLPLV